MNVLFKILVVGIEGIAPYVFSFSQKRKRKSEIEKDHVIDVED